LIEPNVYRLNQITDIEIDDSTKILLFSPYQEPKPWRHREWDENAIVLRGDRREIRLVIGGRASVAVVSGSRLGQGGWDGERETSLVGERKAIEAGGGCWPPEAG
jgi:hypothetical protein